MEGNRELRLNTTAQAPFSEAPTLEEIRLLLANLSTQALAVFRAVREAKLK
jgi:hypothetical protein